MERLHYLKKRGNPEGFIEAERSFDVLRLISLVPQFSEF